MLLACFRLFVTCDTGRLYYFSIFYRYLIAIAATGIAIHVDYSTEYYCRVLVGTRVRCKACIRTGTRPLDGYVLQYTRVWNSTMEYTCTSIPVHV